MLTVTVVRLPSGHDQSGAVLVMVTIWMTVLILMVSFTVDAANWFVHKRHLQMEADAAALAAAGQVLVLSQACQDQPILDEALRYSGAPGSTYNAQIGGTPPANVHMLINSPTYYNQSSPVDSTVNTAGPCAAKMIDVKMTETDLPWYFRVAAVPFINAHARVTINQVDRQAGALPVAVPEVNPKAVKAVFIDESTGATIGESDLTKEGSPDPTTGLAIWDNASNQFPLSVDRDKIGVRILVSSTTSTTCGDPLVGCYDSGSSNGILVIRGWDGTSNATQPNSPAVRDATLVNGTCGDAYFSTDASTCGIGVSANIDFGGLATTDAKVTAVVGGKNYALSYNSTNGRWESATNIPMPATAGPTSVTLNWEEQSGTWNGQTCSTANTNPCKGSFGTVQRHFNNFDQSRAGPIQLAQIWENATTYGAQSFAKCASGCTHNLEVRIGLQPDLQTAQSVSDPAVTLRVAGGGSQNQSLDCDPAISRSAAPAARSATRRTSAAPSWAGRSTRRSRAWSTSAPRRSRTRR